MNKGRNGEIDILRFVFAMTIVIYHFSTNFGTIGWYKGGGIGVEVFFILTGVLMAKHSQKVPLERGQIPHNTYLFLKRKIGSFYPYYISAMLVHLILYDVLLEHNTFKRVVDKIIYGVPNLLLIQNSGIVYQGGMDIGGSWFLSAMIMALFILYPILLYGRENATKIIFAIIGVIGFGFLYGTDGVTVSWGRNLSRMFRAVSEISLGAWGFGIASVIDNYNLTKFSKLILTVLKYVCFGLAIGCGAFGLNGGYVALATILCFVGIILSFSQETYVIQGNKFTSWLGKISLIIYLTHNTIRAIVLKMLGTEVDKWAVVLIICACPIAAHIVMVITDFMMVQLKKLKPLFIREKEELS